MTGLIYVAIIAVWAVVLVPAWLRRHDHLDPERSVDRFARSMQTLGHRPSVLGIPMPTHEDPSEAPDEPAEVKRPSRRLRRRRKQATGTTVPATGSQRAPGRSRRRRQGRLSAAARRRIVLAVLLVALLAVAALVAAGVLIPVALVIPGTLVLAFLALARHQVRAARRRRSRSTQARTARSAQAAPASGPAPVSASATGSTWEARATPLPTYVTAPPAAGYPRVIDTQTPGAWTAAAMLERAQQQKVRAERMAAAKAEAIARARAEQEASQVPTRDDEFLATQAVAVGQHDTIPLRRIRAVNE